MTKIRRVLALDTTTRAGSVALVDDDRIVDERRGDDSRAHAERLPREIVALLDQHGIATADIDLFAVASGPGLFTGLRIGIATLQGLAFVHHRRIAAVSGLEALGQLASADTAVGSLVGVWMDAQRGDVFSALYRVAPAPLFDARRLIEIDGAGVASPAATLERWQALVPEGPEVLIGDGAVIFATTIGAVYPDTRIGPHPVLAGAIGRMGLAEAIAGRAMEPGAVRPLYVRRPDAEIERDRRRAAQ